MVAPSCPALVIHDDDPFRRSLIATLDQKHFTVTIAGSNGDALKAIESRKFKVIIVGVDLSRGKGVDVLEYLRGNGQHLDAAIILVGDPDPELRSYARVVDELVLKPVDPSYVAERALTYCA